MKNGLGKNGNLLGLISLLWGGAIKIAPHIFFLFKIRGILEHEKNN
jgi:hypothetical protein